MTNEQKDVIRSILATEADQPTIDPETGIKPISEWGKACMQGFVRDARFGPGPVIKGTNRDKTRKNIEATQRLNERQGSF
jgi:hypothetical protein